VVRSVPVKWVSITWVTVCSVPVVWVTSGNMGVAVSWLSFGFWFGISGSLSKVVVWGVCIASWVMAVSTESVITIRAESMVAITVSYVSWLGLGLSFGFWFGISGSLSEMVVGGVYMVGWVMAVSADCMMTVSAESMMAISVSYVSWLGLSFSFWFGISRSLTEVVAI